MQGVEATALQPDAGKAEAGKIPAEAPSKGIPRLRRNFNPRPWWVNNLEKGTADGVETGAEKKRDFIPAYGQGGSERGG